MQAESVDVGAQPLPEVRVPGHRALNRQHLLADAQAEGDAIGTRGCLQGPEYAGLVRIAVVVGHVGLALLLDEHLRVSSFIVRVMILCNTACSASSVGAGSSTKSEARPAKGW